MGGHYCELLLLDLLSKLQFYAQADEKIGNEPRLDEKS